MVVDGPHDITGVDGAVSTLTRVDVGGMTFELIRFGCRASPVPAPWRSAASEQPRESARSGAGKWASTSDQYCTCASSTRSHRPRRARSPTPPRRDGCATRRLHDVLRGTQRLEVTAHRRLVEVDDAPISVTLNGPDDRNLYRIFHADSGRPVSAPI
jgi:hypothetical protein